MMRESEVVSAAPAGLTVGSFRMTRSGLVIAEEVDFEEWEAFGKYLAFAVGAVQLWIGDWLNFGERRWGERYSQVMDETGLSYKSLANASYVARQVDVSRRRENLSFGHHEAVAALEPEAQDRLLGLADAHGWTRSELRRQVAAERALAQVASAGREIQVIAGDMLDELPGLGQFDLVIANPPDDGDDATYAANARRWLAAITSALKPRFIVFWFCPPSRAAAVEAETSRQGLPVRSRIAWRWRAGAGGCTIAEGFEPSWTMVLHAGNRPLTWPPEWSDARLDTQTFVMAGTEQGSRPQALPLGLVQRLVACATAPGDRVLDPWAGDGVTGIACGDPRSCVLIEERPEFVAMLQQRFGGDDMRDPPRAS